MYVMNIYSYTRAVRYLHYCSISSRKHSSNFSHCSINSLRMDQKFDTRHFCGLDPNENDIPIFSKFIYFILYVF